MNVSKIVVRDDHNKRIQDS